MYLLTVTLGNSRFMDSSVLMSPSGFALGQHQYLGSINLLLPAVTVNKCVLLSMSANTECIH